MLLLILRFWIPTAALVLSIVSHCILSPRSRLDSRKSSQHQCLVDVHLLLRLVWTDLEQPDSFVCRSALGEFPMYCSLSCMYCAVALGFAAVTAPGSSTVRAFVQLRAQGTSFEIAYDRVSESMIEEDGSNMYYRQLCWLICRECKSRPSMDGP